jgi:hypothetical protein
MAAVFAFGACDNGTTDPVYTVTVATGITGGSISASPTSGTSGTTVTLSNTPDSGYAFDYYTVDGTPIYDGWQIPKSSFTLYGDATVGAVFSPVVYTATIATGITGGSISASPTGGTAGTSIALSNTPDPGYVFDYYTVDGTQIAGSSFALNGNATVGAVFSPDENFYTVTVMTGITGGSISASPTEGMAGTTVALSNTPSSGYVFSHYTVDGTQISGSSFPLNGNVTVGAVFERNYEVTVTTGITGGSIAASPTSGTAGTTVALTNTPSAGYVFSHYTVGGSQIAGSSFTLDGNVTVSAVFERSYAVTITSSITGGSISADPVSGPAGTTITLSNTPDSGYVFSHYTVGGTQIAGSSFTLPHSGTVSAVFERNYEVTVTTDITGGSISADPASGVYNTTVTLSNTPDSDYVLGYYTVGGTRIDGSSFSLTSDVTVSARFYPVVTVATGITGGSISAPSSANVGATITLSNTPDSGYVLGYYTVDGEQITGSSFTLNNPVTVSAVFYPKVTVASGITGGSVNASLVSGAVGTAITLTNTPSSGYTFRYYTVDGWAIQGDTFTLNEPVTVGAFFKQTIPYLVTIAPGITGGSVWASTASGPEGTVVDLSNLPAPGYIFCHYTIKRGTESTYAPIQGSAFIIYEENVQVNAVFIQTDATDDHIGAIGNPSALFYLNNDPTPLEGGNTTVGNAGSETYRVSIAGGAYSHIVWYLNGRVYSQGTTETSITLSKQNSGACLVTVEATPTGGSKNTGSHIFVVEE